MHFENLQIGIEKLGTLFLRLHWVLVADHEAALAIYAKRNDSQPGAHRPRRGRLRMRLALTYAERCAPDVR